MTKENVPADVFLEQLRGVHPAVPTGMMLDLAYKQLPKNPTSAKVQMNMYASQHKPACGDEFISAAREWFGAQDVPDDISETISSLWSDWFDFEVKADFSSKTQVDYGIRRNKWKQVETTCARRRNFFEAGREGLTSSRREGKQVSDEERQKQLELQ